MIDNKMIPSEAVKEIMNDYYPEFETVDFHGQDLVIKNTISVSEVFEIVNVVANACFNDKGEYVPEAYDIALKLRVIDAYTNIEITPDYDTYIRLIYGTDIWTLIEHNVSYQQLDQIYDASKNRIAARLDADRIKFEDKINTAILAINKIADDLSSMFSSVSSDDLRRLIDAVSNGDLHGDKIVQAVLQAQNERSENND